MTAQTSTATPHDSGGSLARGLARNWWLEVLRGVAAIAFGVLAFVWPGLTLLTLVLFYGAFVLVDGVLALTAAVKGGNPAPRWWLALVGVAGVVAGGLTLVWPGITAFVLLIFIASWAIVLGIFEIVGAIRLRKEISGEWLLILNGVLSVLFGLLLLWRPGLGALAVVWIIGTYAILLGAIYIAFGLKLRKHQPGAA
ncbi:MAG: HdeD family acid-resistance protein [Hyphomicrobiales bacterium]|nr:HdeD family acid-resistance protein [Hyphomicrobiales bacterium]